MLPAAQSPGTASGQGLWGQRVRAVGHHRGRTQGWVLPAQRPGILV